MTTTFFVRAPSICVSCLIIPCISRAVPFHLKKLLALPTTNLATFPSIPKKAPASLSSEYEVFFKAIEPALFKTTLLLLEEIVVEPTVHPPTLPSVLSNTFCTIAQPVTPFQEYWLVLNSVCVSVLLLIVNVTVKSLACEIITMSPSSAFGLFGFVAAFPGVISSKLSVSVA